MGIGYGARVQYTVGQGTVYRPIQANTGKYSVITANTG